MMCYIDVYIHMYVRTPLADIGIDKQLTIHNLIIYIFFLGWLNKAWVDTSCASGSCKWPHKLWW
jgi:hypothetical protein